MQRRRKLKTGVSLKEAKQSEDEAKTVTQRN
jgi:hypothetical protein